MLTHADVREPAELHRDPQNQEPTHKTKNRSTKPRTDPQTKNRPAQACYERGARAKGLASTLERDHNYSASVGRLPR